MADKKSPKSAPTVFGSKAQFIRDQPEDMSARDVVDAAAKQGLKISVNHVYNLRAAADKTSARKHADAGTGAGTGAGGQKRSHAPAELERQLRATIAQIGLQRAREILDGVENAFRQR